MTRSGVTLEETDSSSLMRQHNLLFEEALQEMVAESEEILDRSGNEQDLLFEKKVLKAILEEHDLVCRNENHIIIILIRCRHNSGRARSGLP